MFLTVSVFDSRIFTYWHEPASGTMNRQAGDWSHPLRCESWWVEARSCKHQHWSTSRESADECDCRDEEGERNACQRTCHLLTATGTERKTIVNKHNDSRFVFFLQSRINAQKQYYIRSYQYHFTCVWCETSFASMILHCEKKCSRMQQM